MAGVFAKIFGHINAKTSFLLGEWRGCPEPSRAGEFCKTFSKKSMENGKF